MIEVRLEIFVKNPALFFSVHQLKGFIILLYLITGDVNFVHLVALVSSAFLHCQVTIIFFVVGVRGRPFEIMQILFLFKPSSTGKFYLQH